MPLALPRVSLRHSLQAGTEDFMERRMSDNFDLDVQGLQDDAPPDTSASLVALAAQLVEVRVGIWMCVHDLCLCYVW